MFSDIYTGWPRKMMSLFLIAQVQKSVKLTSPLCIYLFIYLGFYFWLVAKSIQVAPSTDVSNRRKWLQFLGHPVCLQKFGLGCTVP